MEINYILNIKKMKYKDMSSTAQGEIVNLFVKELVQQKNKYDYLLKSGALVNLRDHLHLLFLEMDINVPVRWEENIKNK